MCCDKLDSYYGCHMSLILSLFLGAKGQLLLRSVLRKEAGMVLNETINLNPIVKGRCLMMPASVL